MIWLCGGTSLSRHFSVTFKSRTCQKQFSREGEKADVIPIHTNTCMHAHTQRYTHTQRRTHTHTHTRLDLSHFGKYKFMHGFVDTINPVCSCGNCIESLTHFFLHCPDHEKDKKNLLLLHHRHWWHFVKPKYS